MNAALEKAKSALHEQLQRDDEIRRRNGVPTSADVRAEFVGERIEKGLPRIRPALDANDLLKKLNAVTAERNYWMAKYLNRKNCNIDLVAEIKRRLESQTPFNANVLAARFGVCTKTVHRKIELVRKDFGIAFDWDFKKNSFLQKGART